MKGMNEGTLLKLMSRIECYICGKWFPEHAKKCSHCGAVNEDYKPLPKNAWPLARRNGKIT